MNRIILVLAVVFIAACNPKPDSGAFIAGELEAVKANFKKQELCWNKGDLECYVSEAYHPTAPVQTITRAGITNGLDSILAKYQKYFPDGKMGTLHFDEFSYQKLSPDYIYVVGRYNLKFEDREKPVSGWFSVLMQALNDTWYIVSDHSS